MSGDGVAVLDALASAPEATLELERTVIDRLDRPVHFAWGSGGGLDRFEAALPSDPTVADFEVMEATADERLYRLVVRQEETVSTMEHDRAVDASRLSLRATADGVVKEMRFPDRASLSEYFDRVRGEGLELTLLRVNDRAEGRRGDECGLTPKQRDALRTALAVGYFDVPRETDLAALAERLGVSRQATSERLRRGTAALVRGTVADE